MVTMRLSRSLRRHNALKNTIPAVEFLYSMGGSWFYSVPEEAIEQARIIGLTIARTPKAAQ